MTKSKAYTNRKSKEERPEGDFYNTPKSLLWELLKKDRTLSYYNDVLEPFCGHRSLSQSLIEANFKVTEFDLFYGDYKQDFLKYNKKHKLIISNPPFSEFDDMVRHSKEIATHIYFIAKMNFWGAYNRLKNGTWDHLEKIYVFNRQVDYRTPLRNDGLFHVGNLVTGWFHWNMNFNGNAEIIPIDINKYAKLGSYEKI